MLNASVLLGGLSLFLANASSMQDCIFSHQKFYMGILPVLIKCNMLRKVIFAAIIKR